MGKTCSGRFSGKVMLITGSATGIGRATAIRAAKEGAKLILADRKKQEGKKAQNAFTLLITNEQRQTVMSMAV